LEVTSFPIKYAFYWAPEPVEKFSRREKYLAPDRIRTADSPHRSRVSTLSKLPWWLVSYCEGTS